MVTKVSDLKDYSKYKSFYDVFGEVAPAGFINELAKDFYDRIPYDVGIDDYIDSLPVEEVELDKICPTQNGLTMSKLLSKVDLDPNPSSHPMLVKKDGRYYIFDGHHRVAMHKIKGLRTVRCSVLDADNTEEEK